MQENIVKILISNVVTMILPYIKITNSKIIDMLMRSLMRPIHVSSRGHDVHHRFRPMKQLSSSLDDVYVNPLLEIQPHIAVPIIPEDHQAFSATRDEIQIAQKLFMSSKMGDIRYVKGVHDLDSLPQNTTAEVAFVGQSNVGKSSLIKALFHAVPEVTVKTSMKPGHTKLLNFFQVRRAFTLVDMPGYGYRMPENFEKLVEKYLRTRKRLCRSFLLVDGMEGLNETDEIAFNMMEQFRIPYCVVMTKVDKSSRHNLIKNIFFLRDYIVANTQICLPQPFLVSSLTGAGVPLLQAFIAHVTGNLGDEHL